jgi:polyhydroxybutyrate depolymerase
MSRRSPSSGRFIARRFGTRCRIPAAAALAFTLAACSTATSSTSSTLSNLSASSPESVVPVTVAPSVETLAGGGRPATVVLPEIGADPVPLVLVLHGYTSSPEAIDHWFGVTETAPESGVIAVLPAGSEDLAGDSFWNADPAQCCNYDRLPVDDVGYLVGLVDEAAARWPVDPERVYVLGHSNGGFMAHALACQRADRIRGAVSVAGSLPLAGGDCRPSRPVAVLQVHGTADDRIPYPGSPDEYPGAVEVVDRWAFLDGCATPVTVDPIAPIADDLATTVLRAPDCAAGGAAELWSIDGATHLPPFNDDFLSRAFQWLLATG